MSLKKFRFMSCLLECFLNTDSVRTDCFHFTQLSAKSLRIIEILIRKFAVESSIVIDSESISKTPPQTKILKFAMVDEGTRKQLQSIPLLNTRASPRDKDLWVQRLKEELMALIKVTYFCDNCSCTHLIDDEIIAVRPIE